MNVHTLTLTAALSKGGTLVPMETGREIPFPIRRVYFIRDFQPGMVRGKHAHRHLEAVLACV